MRDQEKIQKLKSAVSSEPSKWREKAEYRRANKHWLKYSTQVAMIVLNELERRELSQSDLARIMGVTPQLVSRLVKGGENLTLSTIGQLEKALNISFLNLKVKNPDEETGLDSKTTFSIKSKSDFSYDEVFLELTMDMLKGYSHEELPVSKVGAAIPSLYKIDFSVESEELLCYE